MSTSYTPEKDKRYDFELNPDGEFEPKIPEYWKQDNLKVMGSIMDKFSIKKRYPTLTKHKETLIEPAYLSDKRQIAKISELASQAADTAKAFAGPKRSAAVMSKAQGEAMSQMANVQADIDNKNLQIFSDTQAKNAMISNEFETLNKKALSDYADKMNLTEETYENAIRQANSNILNNIVQRESNRANTYNLNTMYPQFDVHPEHAGMIRITDPKSFFPSDEEDQTNYDLKVKRLEDMIDKGWITKEQGQEMIQDIINTDLKTKKKNPYENVIMNQGYPGGSMAFNPYNQYMNNPMMMQQMMQQQNMNPYGGYSSKGREVPSFPFGMPRKGRRLSLIE
jgi:hypothetical protein